MNVIKLADLDVSGKRVFIRADLNVPQDEAGNITEDTRIRASLASIKYCLEKGAAVMVTSHLGRPTEGEMTPDDSLMPVAVRLGQLLHLPVRLIADWVDGGFEVKPGEVVLLENLRFYKQEEKGDEAFAEKLSKLGDVYVNDAFGTAHRAHASTAVIAKFFPTDKRMFGLLMEGEVAINRADGSGQPFIYRGFKMVDENKLRELRGDQLRKMNENGMLGLIYAHLMSLDLLRVVFARATDQGTGPALA